MRACLVSLFCGVALAILPSCEAASRQGSGSLDRVLPQIRQSVPGTFYDAEGPFFAPDGQPSYRIKWMTPDGRLIWFSVDARSGQIIGGVPSVGRGREPDNRYPDTRYPDNRYQDNRGSSWNQPRYREETPRDSREDAGRNSGWWGNWGAPQRATPSRRDTGDWDRGNPDRGNWATDRNGDRNTDRNSDRGRNAPRNYPDGNSDRNADRQRGGSDQDRSDQGRSDQSRSGNGGRGSDHRGSDSDKNNGRHDRRGG